MTWKLFLDDVREPSYVGESYHTVKVARTVPSAIALIQENGMPSFVYFDNDMGEGQVEGKELAKWLLEQFLDKNLRPLSGDWFSVHSSNPPAKMYIESVLNSYMRHAHV